MITTSINIDIVPLLSFVFLYSILEILITKSMEYYRFIHIQDEVVQEQIEENVTPEEPLVPVNLNDGLENEDISDYDDDDDYEDYDDDDDEDDYDDDDYIDDYEDEIDAYEREEVDEVVPAPVMASPRVSNSVLIDSDGRNLDSNNSETDGLTCPICFDAWTNSGDHQICCLPCGHLYGWSCITKWLKKRRSLGKCPQCNNVSTLEDVRILYVNRLCVADEELHKRVRSLEAKCANLEQKVVAPLTADELINQICSNPVLVQRLATALTELHQPQVFP
ncbi:uncharacterized protein [Rutidosis leptorrhynchoides]|uniref:uncharacterized protein n=1 Tax=Rutidosis leptorrhynchoides TaxID=125765 RepID=UPI003A991C0B